MSAAKSLLHCFVCTAPFDSISEVVKHLRIDHALFEHSKLVLGCCFRPCLLKFATYSGLRKHLQSHINAQQPKSGTTLNDERPINLLVDSANTNSTENDHDSSMDIPSFTTDDVSAPCSLIPYEHYDSPDDVPDNDSWICDELDSTEPENTLLTNFALKLESTGIPKSSLQMIVDATKDLIDSTIDNISTITKDEGIHNQRLNKYLEEQKVSFEKCSSAYKRNKLYTSRNDYVQPVELSIGTRYDNVFDRSLNDYKTVALPCTFMYVPLLETIKFIFSNKDVRRKAFKKTSRYTRILSTYSDGSNYASNPLFQSSRYTIQLHLYYDDFETVNPLGSKTSGHKLGGFYLTIQNLSFTDNTKLDHIFLVALCYTNDIKRYGINCILEPIVRDIKILETDGVQVGNKILKGTIATLSFDNLGGNALYGMVESFSAIHFCRICTAAKIETTEMTTENRSYLRSSNSCPTDEDALPFFGITNLTALNHLQYFNVFDCPSVDIMHDILEGVGPLEIKIFLNYITNDLKKIRIEEINSRIEAFNFGQIEIGNKPSPICLTKPGARIGQRASQTWCLLRFLPFIISDVINESLKTTEIRSSSETLEPIKRKWRVITMLLQIMQIVFSPTVSEGMIIHLRHLIERHHSLFQSEFLRQLTPKHHFMVHYPTVIKRLGPLILLWAMRFEGKHNYFKNLVHQYRNFKKITKTLADQHQRYICYQFKSDCSVDQSTKIETGRGYFIMYSDIVAEFPAVIRNREIDNKSEIFVVQKLRFNLLYRIGFFITIGVDDNDVPIFMEILKLFVYRNSPYCICQRWNTNYYDDDLCAFRVERESVPIYSVISMKKLRHKLTYELHQPYDSIETYIVPKYHIM